MNEHFMNVAIKLSGDKLEEGRGGPFGAIVVRTNDNKIVGRGNNTVIPGHDPTAHAEVQAIRDACKNLKTHILNGCIIYTSCEPCPMCLGSIYWARLDKIYYANTRQLAASIQFDDEFIYDELKKNIKDRVIPGIHLKNTNAMSVFDRWKVLQNVTGHKYDY